MINVLTYESCCNHRIFEDFLPAIKGQIGRHDGGTSFIPNVNEIKQKLSPFIIKGNVTQLIKNDERITLQSPLKGVKFRGVLSFFKL